MVLVHGGAASTYRGVTYLIHADSTIPQRCVFSKTNVPSRSLLCTNVPTILESLETANSIVDHVTIFSRLFYFGRLRCEGEGFHVHEKRERKLTSPLSFSYTLIIV